MEFTGIDLPTIWFILISILFTGYIILDGFDFGVGIIYLFTRSDNDRRTLINAIAPVWDGNEVWLLTGGGALFAAFPPVYAAVFSSFYIALILLLVSLIARAVSVEFHSKVESAGWRNVWDWVFGLGSIVSALLLGVAFGNILTGLPVDDSGNYAGSFWGLLNLYALLFGLMGLAAFIMHGGIYLLMKTEDTLQRGIQRVVTKSWGVFIVLFFAIAVLSVFFAPHIVSGTTNLFALFLLAVFIGVMVIIPFLVNTGRYFWAFIASSTALASVFNLYAVGLYPRLVPRVISGTQDWQYSLTVHNASSSPRALSAMLVIALIGMPIVIAYTIFIYRVFRGKAKGEENGY